MLGVQEFSTCAELTAVSWITVPAVARAAGPLICESTGMAR